MGRFGGSEKSASTEPQTKEFSLNMDGPALEIFSLIGTPLVVAKNKGDGPLRLSCHFPGMT
jgi:hypothetical protein